MLNNYNLFIICINKYKVYKLQSFGNHEIKIILIKKNTLAHQHIIIIIIIIIIVNLFVYIYCVLRPTGIHYLFYGINNICCKNKLTLIRVYFLL